MEKTIISSWISITHRHRKQELTNHQKVVKDIYKKNQVKI